MEFIDKLINCNDDIELKNIVDGRLNELYDSAINCKLIGINGDAKMIHKGIIPRSTQIMFSNNSMSYYNMNNIEYYYDFAKAIRNYKLNNKKSIAKYIQTFSLNYFGKPIDNDIRDTILIDYAYKNSTTDEEMFNILDNIDISVFKNKNITLCTERAALAQNLLSFVGFETYFCIGILNNDGIIEDHAFNVIVRSNDCVIYDTSKPVTCFENSKAIEYVPYIDSFSKDKLSDILIGKNKIILEDYEYIKENGKYVKKVFGNRMYISGISSNLLTIKDIDSFQKR